MSFICWCFVFLYVCWNFFLLCFRFYDLTLCIDSISALINISSIMYTFLPLSLAYTLKSECFQLYRQAYLWALVLSLAETPPFLLCDSAPLRVFLTWKNNRSPWTAALPLLFPRQCCWLTVGLTTPFSHHLLAVNQACHPGAIDRAVSLCEMCLSKPLHSFAGGVTSFFPFTLPVHSSLPLF